MCRWVVVWWCRRELFNAAHMEIFKLMERDTFPRFKHAALFAKVTSHTAPQNTDTTVTDTSPQDHIAPLLACCATWGSLASAVPDPRLLLLRCLWWWWWLQAMTELGMYEDIMAPDLLVHPPPVPVFISAGASSSTLIGSSRTAVLPAR